MIIEYISNKPTKIIFGNGWELNYQYKKKETAVIWQLKELIEASVELEFSALENTISNYYKTRTVKSRADIYYREDEIEILPIGKSMFPSILVVKYPDNILGKRQ